MATVNSFLRHNSKDLFLEAGRGTQKSIEDEDFLTHIPSPLQEQIQQLLATRTSAANNNAETETEPCTIIDRVEQFQFGTRDHVLSISKALLESLSKNDAAILEETVEELLSFIRNVIDVILHVFYIHCTNIPSDDDDDDDDGTDGDVNEKASSVASLCSEIVTKGIEIRKIPFLILEDLVETLPTKTIQLFWNYGPSLWLEDILCKNPISFKHHKTLLQNNPKLKKENLTLFTQGSQYCILRLCNRLLKNISVDSSHVHAQFAGQITMTLAKVFPLSEKSAVNNLGKFNVESIIQFESLNDWYKSNNSDSSSSKGKASTESEKKNMGALNYDFYNSFWTLQQYFTNPVTLLPKAMEKTTLGHDWTNMETFMKTVESVLTAFESNQFPNRLVKDLKSSWSNAKNQTIFDNVSHHETSMDIDIHDNDGAEAQNNDKINAMPKNKESSKRHYKYMTNSQLLHLQLQDPEIRMQILTQFFIIASYLMYNISSNQTLNQMSKERICESLSNLEEKAGTLLKLTPPNGQEQFNSLKWILKERESIWRDWKKTKCDPPIEKFLDAEAAKVGIDNRHIPKKNGTKKQSQLAAMSDIYTYKLDMKTKLPSISKSIANEYLPKYYDFLEEYVEALDPEAGIEEEYHPKNERLFTWRALRLLNDGYIGRLGTDEMGYKMVDVRNGDFEGLVRKIWKEERGTDIAGEMPMAEQMVDEEDDKKGQDIERDKSDEDVENDKKESVQEQNDDNENANIGEKTSIEQEVESNKIESNTVVKPETSAAIVKKDESQEKVNQEQGDGSLANTVTEVKTDESGGAAKENGQSKDDEKPQNLKRKRDEMDKSTASAKEVDSNGKADEQTEEKKESTKLEPQPMKAMTNQPTKPATNNTKNVTSKNVTSKNVTDSKNTTPNAPVDVRQSRVQNKATVHNKSHDGRFQQRGNNGRGNSGRGDAGRGDNSRNNGGRDFGSNQGRGTQHPRAIQRDGHQMRGNQHQNQPQRDGRQPRMGGRGDNRRDNAGARFQQTGRGDDNRSRRFQHHGQDGRRGDSRR